MEFSTKLNSKDLAAWLEYNNIDPKICKNFEGKLNYS